MPTDPEISTTSRQRHSRRRIAGVALVRLLAVVVLLVFALAAARYGLRSLTAALPQAPAVPARGPATPSPSADRPDDRATPRSASDPWASAPPAPAPTAYQCVSGSDYSFQLEPCPPGATTEWSREASAEDLALIDSVHKAEAQAEHDMASQRAALQARYSQLASQSARASAQAAPAQDPPRTVTAGEQHDSRCRAAKQYRDAQLAQAGMNRTFDLIRKLDDIVYNACK